MTRCTIDSGFKNIYNFDWSWDNTLNFGTVQSVFGTVYHATKAQFTQRVF